jgi:hypothetical protein
MLDDIRIAFGARLKLTGATVRGSLRLPCAERQMRNFIDANEPHCKNQHRDILAKLNSEAEHNKNLEIEIQGNR